MQHVSTTLRHGLRVLTAIVALGAAFSVGAAGRPAMPNLKLLGEQRGAAAVQALGARLPEVAAHYRMTPERLSEILSNDPTSRLDRNGRLFFVEAQGPSAATTSAASVSAAAPYDLGQTFLLHSRPGAKRVIYLDFDGHTVSNTGWNSGATINAQPYDSDGKPASFGATELERIQRVWQRVAEDYAPFDVDVTTQDPGDAAIFRTSSTDDFFGTRVVVTRNTFYNCSCGGVAYVGTYDYFSSSNPGYYQPAWVFNSGEVGIAEAASHEAGHNLGLSHDGTSSTGYYSGHGTGATSWAPIMGAGYSAAVTQWSKGEYPNANNAEDDLVVISQNGLALRTDDVGDTAITASNLAGVSSNGTVTASQAGILASATDVDVFTFASGAGTVSLTISPAVLGANADLLAVLRNGQGAIVASSNPVDGLGASIVATVASGSYTLSIEGVGKGDLVTGYSDYGSLGEYRVSGSYPDSGAIAPTARIVTSATSGTAPLAVQFDGSTSSDPDGTIASYVWDFGDGSTGSGAMVSKTYQSAGSFTARLTVTDNQGLTHSTSTVITVSAATLAMNVKSITVTAASVAGGYQCTANVAVQNSSAAPVSGVTVSGSWSGTLTGSVSGVTGSTGSVAIKSGKTKKRGSCTYTVSNLSASGYTYVAPTPRPSGSVSY